MIDEWLKLKRTLQAFQTGALRVERNPAGNKVVRLEAQVKQETLGVVLQLMATLEDESMTGAHCVLDDDFYLRRQV